jgi:hypothetical protein
MNAVAAVEEIVKRSTPASSDAAATLVDASVATIQAKAKKPAAEQGFDPIPGNVLIGLLADCEQKRELVHEAAGSLDTRALHGQLADLVEIVQAFYMKFEWPETVIKLMVDKQAEFDRLKNGRGEFSKSWFVRKLRFRSSDVANLPEEQRYCSLAFDLVLAYFNEFSSRVTDVNNRRFWVESAAVYVVELRRMLMAYLSVV